jgi:AmpE protein
VPADGKEHGPMTIISILIAFSLCHFVRELRHLRRFEWVASFTRHSNDLLKSVPGWDGPVGFLVILGLPLFVAYFLNSLLVTALGPIGGFLLAIVVLVYTFGPRDLDIDVRKVISAEDDEEQTEAFESLLSGPVPEEEEACQNAAIDAVFSKALNRWFGIIFWFALLGIYGALLYRLSNWLIDGDFGLKDEQKNLISRLGRVMDWPVAQLMTLSLAIATDFDSVYSAWKKYHDERGHGLFEANNEFMLTSARTIVKTGHAENDGYADQLRGPMATIKLSMDLVWRSLGVWATVLAILLLVNVIA